MKVSAAGSIGHSPCFLLIAFGMRAGAPQRVPRSRMTTLSTPTSSTWAFLIASLMQAKDSTGCLERSAMEACPVESTSLPLDEAAEAKEYHDEVAHFFIFSLHPGRKGKFGLDEPIVPRG